MRIKTLESEFSISKVEDYSQIDITKEFVFTGRTDEEYSLICPTGLVPANTLEREDGWRMLRFQGILELSMIGVLSRISNVLASNNIGLCGISTYNTDYILVYEDQLEDALRVLAENGYEIVE